MPALDQALNELTLALFFLTRQANGRNSTDLLALYRRVHRSPYRAEKANKTRSKRNIDERNYYERDGQEQMTASEQVLLNLIKQSLFHISPDVPENVDWNDVYREAKDQAILGLIDNCIPKEAERRNRNQYYQIITIFIRILVAQRDLIQLFSDQDIPCAILKGSAAAIYYPQPVNRTMGDVDVIVAQERFAAAAELMARNGYKPVVDEDDDDGRHLAYKKMEYLLNCIIISVTKTLTLKASPVMRL